MLGWWRACVVVVVVVGFAWAAGLLEIVDFVVVVVVVVVVIVVVIVVHVVWVGVAWWIAKVGRVGHGRVSWGV